MICVDHLCYHYKGGRPILRDVSFELETGHFLAVLGNNGVGKSTLLKCMNRILTADSGHCRIDGEDLLTLSHREIAKRVAFVAQHVPDTQMTVHDMVMLGRRPYMTWGVTEHDHHVVHEAMRYLNLEDMRGRFLNRLSGGERQKVMLARAPCPALLRPLSAAARGRGVPLRRRGDLRRRRPAGRLRRDGQHRGRAGAQARAH